MFINNNKMTYTETDNETDNETDSDSDYDSEDDNLYIYGPEEQSITKYSISLCELYNNRIHGPVNSSVLYHYLVCYRFKNLNIKYINDIAESIKNEYKFLHNKNHNIYRNYRNIINNENYIKPEITECIYLNTGHFIAIKKTIWIKLIQRTWKTVLKKREIIIKKRCHIKAILHREIKGTWPKDCCNYPGLKGMLSKLIKFNCV